jgi:hypothetical protein
MTRPTFYDDDERFVSELDVLDPVTVWVRCEMCPDAGPAGEMVWQFDGAWLCAACDADHRAAYDDNIVGRW